MRRLIRHQRGLQSHRDWLKRRRAVLEAEEPDESAVESSGSNSRSHPCEVERMLTV